MKSAVPFSKQIAARAFGRITRYRFHGYFKEECGINQLFRSIFLETVNQYPSIIPVPSLKVAVGPICRSHFHVCSMPTSTITLHFPIFYFQSLYVLVPQPCPFQPFDPPILKQLFKIRTRKNVPIRRSSCLDP